LPSCLLLGGFQKRPTLPRSVHGGRNPSSGLRGAALEKRANNDTLARKPWRRFAACRAAARGGPLWPARRRALLPLKSRTAPANDDGGRYSCPGAHRRTRDSYDCASRGESAVAMARAVEMRRPRCSPHARECVCALRRQRSRRSKERATASTSGSEIAITGKACWVSLPSLLLQAPCPARGCAGES
jgi:hypothetical protein